MVLSIIAAIFTIGIVTSIGIGLGIDKEAFKPRFNYYGNDDYYYDGYSRRRVPMRYYSTTINPGIKLYNDYVSFTQNNLFVELVYSLHLSGAMPQRILMSQSVHLHFLLP